MLLLVLRKSFSLQFSSKYFLIYELISFLFNCSIFIGVSIFVSKERSMEYAAYVLPGLGAMEMMTAALVAPKSFVDTEIGSGTLEYVLLSARSLTRVMATESLLLLGRSLIVCMSYLVIAKILAQSTAFQFTPLVLFSAVLLLIQFWSLGLLAAGLTLATRRGNGLNTLILIGSCLIGGVYFPMESLPRWLRWIGSTNALHSLTRSLRNELHWPDVLIPAFTTIVALVLGLWAFRTFMEWARREGRLYL